MKLKFTRHASQQLKERGVSKELVKSAIERGSKSRQGNHQFLSSYTYIKVAYKKFNDIYIIKTVMVKDKPY